MTTEAVEILLVEDNPADVELTLHALRRDHVANRIHVAHDGEEALDYLFGRGAFSGQAPQHSLKLVLLDLKLPKVDGLEVLRTVKGDPRTKIISGGDSDLLQGGKRCDRELQLGREQLHPEAGGFRPVSRDGQATTSLLALGERAPVHPDFRVK